jgi:hypothetical protein
LLKTRKRWVSVLVAVAMVAAFMVPFAGTASATASYSMTNVATVVSNATTATSAPVAIGSSVVTMDPATAGSIAGQSLYLELPTTPVGYGLYVQGLAKPYIAGAVATTIYCSPIGTTLTRYEVDLTSYNSTGTILNPAGTYGGAGDYYIKVTFADNIAGSEISPGATQVQFSLPLALVVPSGITGNVNLTISAPGSSAFPSGTAVIATVGAAGLTLGVSGTTAISSSGGPVATIDVTENAIDSLNNVAAGGTPLKLTLPPGFSWNDPDTYTVQPMWGDPGLVTHLALSNANNDGRELDISSAYATSVAGGGAAYFQFTPAVSVNEALATAGNITVTVGGNATSNVSSFAVGTYGQFGATCKAQSATSIGAGQEGVNIGELEISEGIPGSLIQGRTVTLTLPTNAVWAEFPAIDTSLSTNYGSLSVQSQMEGTNGTLMQITVQGTTAGQSAPANLFLKNFEVATAVDFSGPLTVTVGGSEGLGGTLTLATGTAPVAMAAASAPSVLLGQSGQSLGNLTITEAAAGDISGVTNYTALDLNSNDQGIGGNYGLCINTTSNTQPNLYIVAPPGVTFDTTPTVTVSSGNLQLGSYSTETSDSYLNVSNEGVLVIPIQASSTTASTITISGLSVTLDNTVPEGPLKFQLKGPAINQETDTNIQGQVISISGETAANEQEPFPNDSIAAQTTVATVSNGIAATSAGTAVFKIGQVSYTLNGNSVTIDVAPYIKDSRTFLPLRYIANALGVADSNIMFDPTTQKVTIIKGDRVVQLTIGSTAMLINGASITMDTAPEITDGRTCLPVAWVAQALSAQIAWDATAQTVTLKF